MGIPALIDAFDMVGDPDELSLMTYEKNSEEIDDMSEIE